MLQLSYEKLKSDYAKITFKKVHSYFTSSKITYLMFFVQSCLRGERKSISKHWGTVTRICRESKDRNEKSYSIYPIYTSIHEPNREKFQKGKKYDISQMKEFSIREWFHEIIYVYYILSRSLIINVVPHRPRVFCLLRSDEIPFCLECFLSRLLTWEFKVLYR